jgi:hypothetical protein
LRPSFEWRLEARRSAGRVWAPRLDRLRWQATAAARTALRDRCAWRVLWTCPVCHESGASDPARQAGTLVLYERYIQAGRRPELRPLVGAWNAELAGLVARELERCGYPHQGDLARVLMAAADGVLIDLLISGIHDAPARAAASLAGLLAALRAGGAVAQLSGRGWRSRGSDW